MHFPFFHHAPRSLAAADNEPTLALLLTAALVGVSAFINVFSIQSILPLLMEDFHASAVQVGNTVGVTTLAIALISPFIGILSDAVGRRGLVIFSVFFLSVPTGLMYFADSVHSVMVYRFLQGLVVPGIAVVIMAYIGEEFRGRAMAKMMAFYVAGTVLGGFLGRFLIGHLSEFMPWRTAFLVMAMMNLIASVFVFAALPKSRRFVPERKIRHAFGVLNVHIHNRDLLAACAVGCCVPFSLVGCFTYINLHLAEEPFLMSPAGLANVFAVYLLGVVVTPIAGKIIGQIGSRKTIMAALCCSSLGLLMTHIPMISGVVLGLAVAAAGIFATQSATVSYIAAKINEGRSL